MVAVVSKINEQEFSSLLSDADIELSSFKTFLDSFPLQGNDLYVTVFNRHSEIIQTQKARFAVANLEKILKATFEVSAGSGFDRMSLRDLSRQTGMSMGAIYSCISKKEDIALMIADIVRLSSEMTRNHAAKSDSPLQQIENSILFHLYASTLLQPWYFFLYFETRSLPEDQQQASKRIELGAIENFELLIKRGVETGEFNVDDPYMVANTIVVLLEDWYLKPWKTQAKLGSTHSSRLLTEQEKKIKSYNQLILRLVRKLLTVS